jgi:hypothetical protein
MGQLEDMLVGVNMTMRHTNVLLAHLYKVQQQKEADKAPHNVRTYTVNVVCPTAPPTAWQMLPRNGARKDVGLINTGPSDLLFCNKQFDPGSILQQISDPQSPDIVLPAPLQMVEIGILASGSTVTLTSTNPVWVYNTKAAGNLGALISILEDVFSVPNRLPTEPGSDGRTFQGYAEIPSATDKDGVQSAKALR